MNHDIHSPHGFALYALEQSLPTLSFFGMPPEDESTADSAREGLQPANSTDPEQPALKKRKKRTPALPRPASHGKASAGVGIERDTAERSPADGATQPHGTAPAHGSHTREEGSNMNSVPDAAAGNEDGLEDGTQLGLTLADICSPMRRRAVDYIANDVELPDQEPVQQPSSAPHSRPNRAH